MVLKFLSLVSAVCLAVGLGASAQKMRPVYEWKYIDYLWESEVAKAEAVHSGDYDHTKSIIIDSDVSRDGRVFVTVIRLDGVPASLNVVSDKFGPGGPLLMPYPSWNWTKKGDCDSITSVYRVAIDSCNRLWVIDNGKINGKQVCPAQLLAFDLGSDTLITRVKIPDHIAYNQKTGEGLLITPIVETEGHHCERTHVYIADVIGHALVVYNGKSIWRLQSRVFAPDLTSADVTIAGESFNLPDGVLGMALSPRSPKRPRYLMSRPFASYDMVSVDTRSLKGSFDGNPVQYTVASNALPSQAVAMAYASNGVLFFGLTQETALGCWNMDRSLTKDNIVIADQNEKTHQFASGLKVIPSDVSGLPEQVWMVTNRYQKLDSGTMNFSEVNYRVMVGYVDQLIANTNCQPKFNFYYKMPGYPFADHAGY